MSDFENVDLPVKISNGPNRIVLSSRSLPELYKQVSLEDLMNYDFDPESVYWVDVQAPTKKDLEHIQDRFGLHPLTVEDIENIDHREKIEVFDKYLFLIVKELHFATGTNHIVISNIYLVLFSSVALTFHWEEVLPIEQGFERLKHRVGAIEQERPLKTADWVVYAIMDAVIDNLMLHVNSLITEAESLDELVLIFHSGDHDELLPRIGLARKQLLLLRSQLWSKREILEAILQKKFSSVILEATKVYLRDVFDHVLAMNDKLQTSQELLGSVNSTYLSRISVEVSETSNELNSSMYRFGVVTTIFLPMNLIAGLFGMNVRVPGQDVENLGWFFGIVGSFVVIACSILFLFRRAKWI